MEDVIKVEAKDFVMSGIEKFSGGGVVNFEVSAGIDVNGCRLHAST